jgi:hypothetical protein
MVLKPIALKPIALKLIALKIDRPNFYVAH